METKGLLKRRHSPARIESNRSRLLLALIGAVASCLAAGPALAGQLSPDLKAELSHRSAGSVRVIVQFNRPNADTNGLVGRIKGHKVFDHRLISGATLVVPRSQLAVLAADPSVTYVTPDRIVCGQSADYTGVPTLGADANWVSPGVDGRGITVAVLDTGVSPNQIDLSGFGHFTSRVVAWKDLVQGLGTPYDDNGHGTHVAGIVAGNGIASNWFYIHGAPEAQIAAVKVLDSTGAGSVSTVINGIDWCVQNRTAYNIRVINLSLGHLPQESYVQDPLCKACEAAVRAGIVVVCAAGNLGKNSQGQIVYGGIHAPGNDPGVITVGSLNTNGDSNRANDVVDTYSSRGPTYVDQLVKPDLVAPGNKIVSIRAAGSYLDTTYPQNIVSPSAYGSGSSSSSYYVLSGTSMAAPQVCAVVAEMLERNPGLTPNIVKAVLMYTAQHLNLTDPSTGQPLSAGLSVLTQGAGSVNAIGAVQVAGQINTGALLGVGWFTGSLAGQTTTRDGTFSWSDEILYGSHVLWGPNLLTSDQVLWGDPLSLVGSVVLGDQVLWGDPVSWAGQVLPLDNGVVSDQIIWGGAAIWTDNLLWGDGTTASSLSNDAMVNGE